MNRYYDILIRYMFLILISIPNLFLFYLILNPLTIYPVYFLLALFFNPILQGNIIVINHLDIEIIKSCVAGSAYYLLLILNLAIPKVNLKKRLKMILFAFGIFLFFNILRIIFLSLLALSNNSVFSIAHKFSWYLLSIIFVIGIWFLEVYIFKIKSIPVYSDIKFLYKKSKC